MEENSLKTANDYADYWYYPRKCNVIPFDTKNREPIIDSFIEYQSKRIPKKVFEHWKREGLFEKGMAIFPGKIYSDDSKDLYLVALDFDTKEAIEEFCSYFGQYTTINELANITIVEQHQDNPGRAHLYLLSPIPFPNKSSDSKIGLEVKSKGEHGLMFCSNSPHKNGCNYQITGIKEPLILSKLQAIDMILHLNGICKKHGLSYLDRKTDIKSHIKKMTKSLKIDQRVRLSDRARRATHNSTFHSQFNFVSSPREG